MYKVPIESVTGISHYMPSYVRVIRIIVMLHVFAAMLAAMSKSKSKTSLLATRKSWIYSN